jgi:type IV secretory pathway VirD2 relaxase
LFIEESWRDPHQYLWLFSPEAGDVLDLREFGREVMAQASRDVGHPLVYLSAAHYNTNTPHVHTVVRGRDAEGKRVHIDLDYLRGGLREAAESIASRMIGATPDSQDWTQERQADEPWWLSVDHEVGHSLVPWEREQDRGWER